MYFSLIIPSFNELDDIQKCIESCLTVDYNNYEIIIIDKSNDGTFEFLINRYKNLKIFKQLDNGLNNAYNFGINKSIGDVIVLLTADNILPKDFLIFLEASYLEDLNLGSIRLNSIALNIEQPYSRLLQNLQDYKYDYLKHEPTWSEGFSFRKNKMTSLLVSTEVVGGTDNLFAQQFKNTKYFHYYIFYHIVPHKLSEIYIQNINRGRSIYSSYKLNKNPLKSFLFTFRSICYKLLITFSFFNYLVYLFKLLKLKRRIYFREFLYLSLMDLSMAFGGIRGILENKSTWK
jgi:glycosyltransferase involved in cell wall biosynthesis